MAKRILIDTNLLLLSLFASLRPDLIGSHRRLRAFDRDDAELLDSLVDDFQDHVTVPGVLAEASNLIGSFDGDLRLAAMSRLAHYVSSIEEVYYPSKEHIATPEFLRIGLTDATIVRLGRDNVTTITADSPLAQSLAQSKLPHINFNHHRTPLL